MSITTIISNFVTFYKNIKYIFIGAKILRENLTPKNLRGITLFQYFTQKNYWKTPKRFYMEIGKGNFVILFNPIIKKLYFYYKQLFLTVLRYFTNFFTKNVLQNIREKKNINQKI